jgi:ATPase subunit of ABC transporter with duplicated ATPase domains
VVVSHDRAFLSRTVTRIVELDLAQRRVAVYGGGYDAYLGEREVARRHAREAYDQYAGTRTQLEERPDAARMDGERRAERPSQGARRDKLAARRARSRRSSRPRRRLRPIDGSSA